MKRNAAPDGNPTVYSESQDTKRANEMRRTREWDADMLLVLLREEHGEAGRADIYPGIDAKPKAKRAAR